MDSPGSDGTGTWSGLSWANDRCYTKKKKITFYLGGSASWGIKRGIKKELLRNDFIPHCSCQVNGWNSKRSQRHHTLKREKIENKEKSDLFDFVPHVCCTEPIRTWAHRESRAVGDVHISSLMCCNGKCYRGPPIRSPETPYTDESENGEKSQVLGHGRRSRGLPVVEKHSVYAIFSTRIWGRINLVLEECTGYKDCHTASLHYFWVKMTSGELRFPSHRILQEEQGKPINQSRSSTLSGCKMQKIIRITR